MKKIFFVFMAVCFMSSLTFAEEAAKAVSTTGAQFVLRGDILDNMCVDIHKDIDILGEFVKTHTKKCAIAGADTGYSIFANGGIYKFDKASDDKIVQFLKKGDSKLQVKVTVKQAKGGLDLVSIENQK